MPIEIKIPRLGWSMEEGVFSGWLKKDGDAIKTGDLLFTLEGEKAAQDIESMDSGILRIPADSPAAGSTVKVGQVIGHLVAENETAKTKVSPATTPTAASESKPAAPIAPPKPVVEEKPISTVPAAVVSPASSPRARRRAAQLGVNLDNLRGSGSTGRIIEADVVKAAAKESAPPKPATVSGTTSTMRRNIAERTALSFAQIPHFYLRAEADATALIAMREHLVSALEQECGVRITVTDFLLRAQALALRDFPAVNAVWQNNGVVKLPDADVGVVVSLPDGLVIPIIRAAQKLSFVQLARERSRLVAAVRAGKFTAEMCAGGATSLSNLGIGRVDEFTAIIPPHQSSILAVGCAAPRPFVVEERLQIRTTLKLCLSVDHRVLDGGPAAEYLGRVVELLETPKLLANSE